MCGIPVDKDRMKLHVLIQSLQEGQMQPGDGAGRADGFGVATGGAPYDDTPENQAQAIRENELRERARLARQAQAQERSRLNRRVHRG